MAAADDVRERRVSQSLSSTARVLPACVRGGSTASAHDSSDVSDASPVPNRRGESPKTVTPTPHSLHVTARSTHMHGAAHRNRHDRRSGTDRRHDQDDHSGHRAPPRIATPHQPLCYLSATSDLAKTSPWLRQRAVVSLPQWSPSLQGKTQPFVCWLPARSCLATSLPPPQLRLHSLKNLPVKVSCLLGDDALV